MIALALALHFYFWLPLQDTCPAAIRAALQAAADLLLRDGPAAAEAQLQSTAPEAGCTGLRVARLGLAGWHVARAAAQVGGTAESLSAARAAAAALEPLATHSPAAEYAHAAVRAAMAAAQDERPEMSTYLEHARSVDARRRDGEPPWPGPIDMVEAELWMEVDDYGRACSGYRAALPGLSGAQAERVRAILAGPKCTAIAGK